MGEIRPGDHACLPFVAGDEQAHIVGAFVQDGLAHQEKVVYLGDACPDKVPGLLLPGGANHFTETGQLRFIAPERVCLTCGRLDPDRMLTIFEVKSVPPSIRATYRAVRISADLSWVLNEPGGSGLILACEDRLEAAVAPSTMAMAICQFNQTRCAPDQFIALKNAHEVLVAANPEFDDGVLRITRIFALFGLRIEGELDAARLTVFTRTLSRITSARRQVHLDFTHVHFIDLHSLNLLTTHALRLPHHHAFVLDNLPPHIESVIDIVGWHHFPGIARGKKDHDCR